MNEINFRINDKTLMARNFKKNKTITCNVDSIDMVYLAKINNPENEQRDLAILAATDFDDKVLIYKSLDEQEVKHAYKKLTTLLKSQNPNFVNCFPRCINMEKVQSVRWENVPFKYIATIDFGKRIAQFRTYEDEFNKIIDRYRRVKNKDSKVEI